VSGAEGLYEEEEVPAVSRSFTARALAHERGPVDNITVTVDPVEVPPLRISCLPLLTIRNGNPNTACTAVASLLGIAGIGEHTALKAMGELLRDTPRSGAVLTASDGRRLEPGSIRGVRVSRMGLDRGLRSRLARGLGRHGLNNGTVREALLLSSKVNHHPDVVAELCISDDPGYTTGYVASKTLGYCRIPCIKEAIPVNVTPYAG